jgi:hypothetical protein
VVTGRLVRPRSRSRSNHRVETSAGPDRARRRRDRLFDPWTPIVPERASTEATDHHAAFVDHEAGIPAGFFDSASDVFQALVEAARGNVGAKVGAGTRLSSRVALEREAERAPVGLASHI